MTLVPLGDRVVLKQVEAEETTKSGIVLPGQAQEKPQQAEVVAVGIGVTVGTLSSAAIASAFLCSLSTFFLCWSSRVSASISRINRIITIIRSFISLFFFLFRFCFPLFVIDKSASPLLFLVRYYPTVRLLILFHPSNRYRVYMVKFQWKLSGHQVCGISVM